MQTMPPQHVGAWPHYGSISIKFLSYGHNNSLLSSGFKITGDNLAIGNLNSNPVSCTTAVIGTLVLNVFYKKVKAKY